MRTERGRLCPLVALDRTTKGAVVARQEHVARRTAVDFLRRRSKAVSSRVHALLTDNGTRFTGPTGDGWTPDDIERMRAQGTRPRPFLCACPCAERRCAPADHARYPWTNRTSADATVKRFHSATHDQLRTHRTDFVTPYEAICWARTDEPHRFTANPHRQTLDPTARTSATAQRRARLLWEMQVCNWQRRHGSLTGRTPIDWACKLLPKTSSGERVSDACQPTGEVIRVQVRHRDTTNAHLR